MDVPPPDSLLPPQPTISRTSETTFQIVTQTEKPRANTTTKRTHIECFHPKCGTRLREGSHWPRLSEVYSHFYGLDGLGNTKQWREISDSEKERLKEDWKNKRYIVQERRVEMKEKRDGEEETHASERSDIIVSCSDTS